MEVQFVELMELMDIIWKLIIHLYLQVQSYSIIFKF